MPRLRREHAIEEKDDRIEEPDAESDHRKLPLEINISHTENKGMARRHAALSRPRAAFPAGAINAATAAHRPRRQRYIDNKCRDEACPGQKSFRLWLCAKNRENERDENIGLDRE